MEKVKIWVRAVAITLLIAMVYYFAGYRIVYSFVMHDAKEEAAKAIEHHNSITSLVITTQELTNLNWTEKNKEFNYNGQLYDIVSIEKAGDSCILKVYCDKNETRWASAMHDFIKVLFPADNSKKPNQGEGFISAFQKEYTPLDKVKLGYTPESTKVIYDTGKTNRPSLLLISPIWHPPLF